MGLTQIPLFSALTDRMRWHQTRQGLLAENVANAETPGYRGRDLKAYNFDDHLREAFGMSSASAPADPRHIEIASIEADGFNVRAMNNFEITPEGNGVTLEDEMMKVSSNQMDYQAITTLYSRSIKILKTALGRA